MKRKLKGFTLVELVITIAIVIILSIVSIPVYRGYVNKAKMAEGYALLGLILSAEKAYFSEYGMFLDNSCTSAKSALWTCNDEVTGIDARGNKYFTWFSAGHDTVVSKLYKFGASVVKPEGIGSIDKTCLRLWYDITTGSTIFEA